MSRPPRIVEAAALAGGAQALHDALTPGQRQLLEYDWSWWQRPLEQVGPREFLGQEEPPGLWTFWLVLAGAGFGKTRLGAEWSISKAQKHPGCRLGLIAATAKDAREVMWEGESGIWARCPPWWKPRFNVTDQCIEFPNGSLGFLYSAEVPETLRGPQHHFVWFDEPAKCRRLQDTFDLMFHRLRLGTHPQGLLTTTPKRLSLLHKLVKDPSTVITRGSTMDNAANLPAAWLQKMLDDYGQTTLGRQELWGELFENLPGALWQQGWIDGARISQAPDKPGEVLELLAAKGVKIRRIVVGLDPATTSKEESDACGICVAALGTVDGKDHGYVLEDATERASPDAWGRRVVDLVRKWRADCVVAETTMGGETIPAIIRLIDDKIKTIEKGGNRGKKTRAEPVAALYEQGRIHHVGMFTALEDQMCQYTLDTKKSPNNLDAAVYALGELLLHGGPGYFAAI